MSKPIAVLRGQPLFEVVTSVVIAGVCLAALFVGLCLSPTTVQAQGTGTLTGTVTDAKTKAPIPSANIVVLGTPFGANSRNDGSYR